MNVDRNERTKPIIDVGIFFFRSEKNINYYFLTERCVIYSHISQNLHEVCLCFTTGMVYTCSYFNLPFHKKGFGRMVVYYLSAMAINVHQQLSSEFDSCG